MTNPLNLSPALLCQALSLFPLAGGAPLDGPSKGRQNSHGGFSRSGIMVQCCNTVLMIRQWSMIIHYFWGNDKDGVLGNRVVTTINPPPIFPQKCFNEIDYAGMPLVSWDVYIKWYKLTTGTASHIAMFFLWGQWFTRDWGQNSSLQIDDSLILQSPHLFFTLLCFSHSLFKGISLFTSFILADGHIGCLSMFNCSTRLQLISTNFGKWFLSKTIHLFSHSPFHSAFTRLVSPIPEHSKASMHVFGWFCNNSRRPKWKPIDSHLYI